MSTLLELVTSDGVRLHARRDPSTAARRGSAVLVHGFATTSDDERIVAAGLALQERGLDVVTYDARGHGRSGGEATLGDLERLDVAAAVEAIADDGGPVILVGESMGAIAALRFAVAEPTRVSGIVTISCPARWRLPRNARGVLSAVLTQTPPGRYVARRSMRVHIARGLQRHAPPIELVTQVQAPLALVHGRVDPFISWTDAEALHAAAPHPKRLTIVDDLGHAFQPAATDAVLSSLDWLLSEQRG
jgi:pimeloyl-ACP methyl ester carboxylesterase